MANNLMQVSTGSIEGKDQALRIISEVCIIYLERNEALVNAGVLALPKETSSFPGYGHVASHPDWFVLTVFRILIYLDTSSHYVRVSHSNTITPTLSHAMIYVVRRYP